MTRETLTADLRTLISLVQERQLPFLAAAIAYYAFLSVVPLLIIGLTLATTLAGQALATELLELLDEFLTPEAATLLESTLVDGTGRGGVTALGLVVLIWGALRVFRGLDIAFSQIYGDSTPKPLLEQIRDALLAVVGITLAIVATIVISGIISYLRVPLAGLGGSLGLLVVLTIVFYPVYYIFPAPVIAPREAVPGAIFAAVGWTILGTVFGIYAANAGSFELYGVLGGVLLLLIWFYFGGLILLFGAAVNVVIGERVGDRQLQHEGLRPFNQHASMSEPDGPNDGESADEDATAPPGRSASGPTATDEATKPGSTPADVAAGGPSGAADPTESATPGPTGRADPDVSARITQEDIDDLRRELDEMEDRLETKTVDRDEFESELKGDMKKYVRSRTRRGKATGWGPYLVLLYGTAMTLGAFFLLSGGWAVLAMLVIWLSTLGLYTLMVLVGMTVKGASLPGKLIYKLKGLR